MPLRLIMEDDHWVTMVSQPLRFSKMANMSTNPSYYMTPSLIKIVEKIILVMNPQEASEMGSLPTQCQW